MGLAEALSYGREYMLQKFVNLSDDDAWNYQTVDHEALRQVSLAKKFGKFTGVAAPSFRKPDAPNVSGEKLKDFIKEFGPLYPSLDLAGHCRYIWLFRGVWKQPGEEESIRDDRLLFASDFLSDIFNRAGTTPKSKDPRHPNYRPLVRIDFVSGRIRIIPKTLLDLLAAWLIQCRKNLAICEWKGCLHKYFVREHSKNKYCSPDCSWEAEKARKSRWAKKSRGLRSKRRHAQRRMRKEK